MHSIVTMNNCRLNSNCQQGHREEAEHRIVFAHFADETAHTPPPPPLVDRNVRYYKLLENYYVL